MEEEDDDLYAPEDAVAAAGKAPNFSESTNGPSTQVKTENMEDAEEEESDSDSDIDIIVEKKDGSVEPPARSRRPAQNQNVRLSSEKPSQSTAPPKATDTPQTTRAAIPNKSGANYPEVRTSSVDVEANPTYPPTGKPITDIDIDTGWSSFSLSSASSPRLLPHENDATDVPRVQRGKRRKKRKKKRKKKRRKSSASHAQEPQTSTHDPSILSTNSTPHSPADLAEHTKPWRLPGADQSDYFNYGFDEFTWTMYCMRQKGMRDTLTAQREESSNFQKMLAGGGGMPGMPPIPGMPGADGSGAGAVGGGGAGGDGGGGAAAAAAAGGGMPAMPGMPNMSPEMMTEMMGEMMAQGITDPSQLDFNTFMNKLQQMQQGGGGGGMQGAPQGPSGFGGGQGGGQMGYGGAAYGGGGYGGGGGGGYGGGGGGGGRGRGGRRWQ
ncbi:MAG: hypothetical protein Q9165_006177 [Trypethelium subeluteriae]